MYVNKLSLIVFLVLPNMKSDKTIRGSTLMITVESIFYRNFVSLSLIRSCLQWGEIQSYSVPHAHLFMDPPNMQLGEAAPTHVPHGCQFYPARMRKGSDRFVCHSSSLLSARKSLVWAIAPDRLVKWPKSAKNCFESYCTGHESQIEPFCPCLSTTPTYYHWAMRSLMQVQCISLADAARWVSLCAL